MQFAQPSPGHGVPGFTLFPMSLFAHLTMLVSDCGVGAERILSLQNSDALCRHPCRPRFVIVQAHSAVRQRDSTRLSAVLRFPALDLNST